MVNRLPWAAAARTDAAGADDAEAGVIRHDRDEFARQLELHDRHVRAYILALLPNRHDADEVLQETYLRLFEQVDEWDPRKDFRAWARAIARFQVLTWRKRRRREKARFADEFLEAVDREHALGSDELGLRGEALERCLGRLDSGSRRLLELTYGGGQNVEQAAEELHRSVAAAYKALQRIRKLLHECIEGTVRAWEQT